jgi:gamma-glutamyltranspeptidase/glutathione hydrolase
MAAALTVVEPTGNGIGSDAFALVWAEGRLHGLNGSGRSPSALTPAALRECGHDIVPERGWGPVTVPGAPAAWRDLQGRFGKLEFSQVLEPAVRLARDGFSVSPVVARYWERGHRFFLDFQGPEFEGWEVTFTPTGRAPVAGERVVFPDHAGTLERIAASHAADFYRGDLAEEIDVFSRRTGGYIRADDLAAHRNVWVDPVSVRYRDVELWELPPNGQGIVALAALRILDGLPPGKSWDDPEGVHLSIEAVKLGFADALAHVADPGHMLYGPETMLDEEYLATRRESIAGQAMVRSTGLPRDGGTVYLAAVDADGMMVSYIQSNYMGFGSGVVVPGTGISLQNRGACFRMEPDHPNALGPGKRPLHTIIPGFLTRDGKPWGPMGVMGGHMQPQGHVQVVRDLVDYGLSPQAALDLPRWRWHDGLRVEVENGWPDRLIEELRDRNHIIASADDQGSFGRGQIILDGGDGSLFAGSNSRADGRAQTLSPREPGN